MSYNFIYCLTDLVSHCKKYFSSESMAFAYADSKGMGNFVVEVIRYCYDLGD